MDRREFLKSTGAAAAAATAVTTAAEASPAAPSVGKGVRELRVAIACEDGFAGPADWARRLTRNLVDLGGGRFHVVPVFGVTDAAASVRAGEAELCFDTANSLLDIHRGFAYFAGLPGEQGLAPRDLQTWISFGGGQALWDDLADDAGLKPLLAAHTGAQSLLLSTRRVDHAAALGGMKAHVGGLARDVARGLGMDAVTLPQAQLAQAMANGDVEIAECGGAIASYAAGLLRTAPYSAGTSINQNGTSMYLGVSRTVWDSLGAADQALLAHAASSEFQQSVAEEEAHRHMLFPAPAPDRVWPIAADLAHAIARVSAAVVAHAAGTDAKSRRIADSFSAFQRATGAGSSAAV